MYRLYGFIISNEIWNLSKWTEDKKTLEMRAIKSRRMRWAGHVARMGEERGRIGSWWGNRRGGDHWGDLGVDGWIILGWISRR